MAARSKSKRYAIASSIEDSSRPLLLLKFYDEGGFFVVSFSFDPSIPLTTFRLSAYTFDWVLYGQLPEDVKAHILDEGVV